jgi:hypothetical protein
MGESQRERGSQKGRREFEQKEAKETKGWGIGGFGADVFSAV